MKQEDKVKIIGTSLVGKITGKSGSTYRVGIIENGNYHYEWFRESDLKVIK